MWFVAQDWTEKSSDYRGNLWSLSHRTCNKTARTGSRRPGWFFLFIFSMAGHLQIFLVKPEINSKLIRYKKSRFDATSQTQIKKKHTSSGCVRPNVCSAWLILKQRAVSYTDMKKNSTIFTCIMYMLIRGCWQKTS